MSNPFLPGVAEYHLKKAKEWLANVPAWDMVASESVYFLPTSKEQIAKCKREIAWLESLLAPTNTNPITKEREL